MNSETATPKVSTEEPGYKLSVNGPGGTPAKPGSGRDCRSDIEFVLGALLQNLHGIVPKVFYDAVRPGCRGGGYLSAENSTLFGIMHSHPSARDEVAGTNTSPKTGRNFVTR